MKVRAQQAKSHVLEEILEFLREKLGDRRLNGVILEDVRIGLLYAGVKLSSGHGGVAYTFMDEAIAYMRARCMERRTFFSGMRLVDALKLSFSWDLVEAAVGVAAINAASQLVFEERASEYEFSDVDVVELVKKDDDVVMVGYFAPLVPRILKKTPNLVVIERKPAPGDIEILPDFASEKVLPEADVVIVSGSTLVNKTIDRILELSKNARDVVLLGPTASVIPDPLFRRGVTAVMGIRITDADKMLKIVSEAGGTRWLLAECAEKFAILKERK
ncbi:MAG: Rossmann-like domain-containing protein [Candidatus Baldrarchaeia archaeon]